MSPLLIKKNDDTITAIATAPGRGSLGVIRISGPQSFDIAYKITNHNLKNRYAHYLSFKNIKQEIIDQGIVIYFKSPHSYTGEDIVELQAHGGPIVLNMILEMTLACGARLAQPGEFTERAFLNNKIDLTQAEAISDIINASSEEYVKSAVRSLEGALSININKLINNLIKIRTYVESNIDFPEEDHTINLKEFDIELKLKKIEYQLNNILKQAQHGVIIREGIKIVIIGKPNVGKSSLMNALSSKETSIVTNIEGTTRDSISEYIEIKGITFHIIDTAGLRLTDNIIEQKGIERTLKAIKNSNHIIFMMDFQQDHDIKTVNINNILPEFSSHFTNDIPVTYVYNKIDLKKNKIIKNSNNIYISAKYNIGIDKLIDHILKSAGYIKKTNEGTFMARTRHINALYLAKEHIQKAILQYTKSNQEDILAEEIHLAHQALSTITGEFTNNDLLSKIFSTFCIGK